jgi:hypothetical protein
MNSPGVKVGVALDVSDWKKLDHRLMKDAHYYSALVGNPHHMRMIDDRDWWKKRSRRWRYWAVTILFGWIVQNVSYWIMISQ